MIVTKDEREQLEKDSRFYNTFLAVMYGLPPSLASLLEREKTLNLFGIYIVRDELGAPTMKIEHKGIVTHLVRVQS